MAEDKFTGFSPKTLTFFRQLAKNNSKTWFDAHRDEYDSHVVAPARAFVVAMGEKLRAIAPGVNAEPKVNRSLFRINRDTRFSSDKSPYKTHLGIWMWEGPHDRMANSGFYFHLEPTGYSVGVGMYMFPKEMLDAYRHAVVHPVHGAALADAVRVLGKRGYGLGGEQFKRVPRGFDPEHGNADLLRYGGLWTGSETSAGDELFSAKLIDACFRDYKKMLPLHQWLLAFTEREA